MMDTFQNIVNKEAKIKLFNNIRIPYYVKIASIVVSNLVLKSWSEAGANIAGPSDALLNKTLYDKAIQCSFSESSPL